nr:potassium channel subfamily T member 2-like [Biomphalaria glabrata]
MTEQALIYDLRQLYTFVVRPDALFLDTLAHFPLVYYMTGSIWSVDDLLVARITQDSYLVVVKRNPDSNYEGEEFLEDSSTIQKIVSEESYCQEVPDVWSPVRRLLLTGRQVPFAIYRTQSVDNLKVHASSSSGHKADHNT